MTLLHWPIYIQKIKVCPDYKPPEFRKTNAYNWFLYCRLDELDSYMYQTVGHMGITKLAEAMELPLYRMETKGKSTQTGKSYVPTDDDEVEDLFNLLKLTKDEMNVEAVAVGAIFSDYQRVRVENV